MARNQNFLRTKAQENSEKAVYNTKDLCLGILAVATITTVILSCLPAPSAAAAEIDWCAQAITNTGITISNREYVTEGWGNAGAQGLIQLTANSGTNSIKTAVTGEGFSVKLVGCNQAEWRIVAEGVFPEGGISFPIFYQWGTTSVSKAQVTVTGSGIVPIVSGVTGTGRDSMNEVRFPQTTYKEPTCEESNTCGEPSCEDDNTCDDPSCEDDNSCDDPSCEDDDTCEDDPEDPGQGEKPDDIPTPCDPESDFACAPNSGFAPLATSEGSTMKTTLLPITFALATLGAFLYRRSSKKEA